VKLKEESKESKQAESPSSAKVESKRTSNLMETDECETLKQKIDEIVVHAFSCTQMPSGSNMIKMLNISGIFKNQGFVEEYYQSIFFSGLTMVSARKYVQSVEFFRIIQKHIFNTLHNIPDDIEESTKSIGNLLGKSFTEKLQGDTKMIVRQVSSQSLHSESKPEEISKQAFKNLIHRAAKLEILIADCCSQHSQLQEKLEAFKRAAILYKIKNIEEFRTQLPVTKIQNFEKPSSNLPFIPFSNPMVHSRRHLCRVTKITTRFTRMAFAKFE
jgi:hypothetical protein